MATTTDRKPLLDYLKVQRATDREVARALNLTTERINRQLQQLTGRTGLGAAVRRDQLQMTQAAIQRELADLWRKLGNVVEARRADAAAAAVESAFNPELLRSVMPAAEVAQLMRAAEAQARGGVGTVQARMKLSQRTLAQSVYASSELATGKIDDIVNAALARGASARELARDVRQYIRPDVRGGVKYSANRLARTELNNAFHAQQVLSGVQIPWTTGMRWNLSGSHPRPDECNQYAESVHYEGGDAGVFRPSEVPGKPHPNCLCFMTAEQNSREEFVNAFVEGRYDSFLDEVTQSSSIVIR